MSVSLWEATLSLPVSPARDHIRGRLDAPVTLLEYGDYECPFCGAAHSVVDQVHKLAGNGLAFVYRHFPMTTVHPHAQRAAEAGEAAGAQGKFWAFHGTLFEQQQNLEDTDLLAYAGALGLDVARFRKDLIEHVHLPKVREDFLSGVHSGVNGTPTFYINGVRHDGAWDLRSLAAAIQIAARAD